MWVFHHGFSYFDMLEHFLTSKWEYVYTDIELMDMIIASQSRVQQIL